MPGLRERWLGRRAWQGHRLRGGVQIALAALALPGAVAVLVEMRDLSGIAGDDGEGERGPQQPP